MNDNNTIAQQLMDTPAQCPCCEGNTNEYTLNMLGACCKCAHEVGDC